MQRTDPIQIAYADDHSIVRRAICELLNSLDICHVAIEASNGKELLEKLEVRKGGVDIIMLDIFMPVMDGFDTLVAIRQRWPDIKVLILTGLYTEYNLTKMILAGANGYMVKDCSQKELETAITSLYDHGMYYSEIMNNRFFRAVLRNEIKLPKLTEHEETFLKYCCSDLSYMQIADKMGVTFKSVDWYRESLFKKLKVKNRSSLVMYAIRFGLVQLDVNISRGEFLH